MTSFFDFDEIFGNIINNGKRKGKWDVKQIDESGVKGYIIQGRFWSDQPLDPFKPFEPLNPWERRPMPQRRFSIPENAVNEIREPFVDIFEEETAVKIYVALPGEEKDDIQLNITEGKVEVKSKNFYKMINVPRNIDVEKALSMYNNGVLTTIIQKKEHSPEKNMQTIEIE